MSTLGNRDLPDKLQHIFLSFHICLKVLPSVKRKRRLASMRSAVHSASPENEHSTEFGRTWASRGPRETDGENGDSLVHTRGHSLL